MELFVLLLIIGRLHNSLVKAHSRYSKFSDLGNESQGC